VASTPAKGNRPRYPRDTKEFDRAIDFVDATFAVALTLLVTTLEVDDVPSAFTSLSALDDAVGAQFFAFVVAFAVVAAYWLANHRMVVSFAAIDTPTIVVQLFLIAAVVLLPFTTASVGDPAADDLALPTAVMAVSLAAVSSLHTLVWVVASRRGLLDHTPTPAEWRETVINGMTPVVVFAASVPIAYLISPDAGRLTWLALLVLNPAVGTLTARARRPEGAG
jgi:uncharacterized membrane protein